MRTSARKPTPTSPQSGQTPFLNSDHKLMETSLSFKFLYLIIRCTHHHDGADQHKTPRSLHRNNDVLDLSPTVLHIHSTSQAEEEESDFLDRKRITQWLTRHFIVYQDLLPTNWVLRRTSHVLAPYLYRPSLSPDISAAPPPIATPPTVPPPLHPAPR